MKHFTKKLTLLTLLAGLCGSAWADVINATLDHTASSSRDGSNGITTTVDQEKEHYNNTKAAAWGGWAYAQFSFTIPSGHSIASAKLTWGTTIYGRTNTVRDNNIYYVNAGVEIDYESLTSTTDLNLTGNATYFTNVLRNSSDNNSSIETDVTSAVQTIAATQSYIIFEWTNNAAGADLYGKVSEHKPTLVITTVAETLYTATFSETTGLTPTIAIFKDEDRTEPITNGALRNNTTYYYTATLSGYYDYNGSFKVNGDNPSVSFAMAAKPTYTYSVYAVDENETQLMTLATATAYEGETRQLIWSKYINVDGQWYVTSENSFVVNATGAGSKNVKYEKSNIAYFIECENMNGVRSDRIVVEENEGYSGFKKVRINNYYPTIYTDVFEEGGVYNLVLPYHNSNSSNSTYQIRTRDANGNLTDVTEWTCERGSKTYTLNNIEIPAGSSLAISCDGISGNSNARMDYLTLTKIATVPGTLAAGKYATRIFPFTPTVPSGVKFYSCAGMMPEKANTLALQEVSTPEANRPYILENTTGADIDITQAGVDTHEADTYDDGLLTGVFANTEITSGYVLQTQGEKQSFYKVVDPINVPPYRAYLNYSAGVKSIGFDTTTAINTLEVLTSGAYEGIYSVDGVKLNRMEKGVNILKMADGTTRKVIVK